MYRRKLMLAAAVAALTGSPAVAQETRRLDFGVRAKVVHDTNFARSSKAEADLRGVSQDDTIFTPSMTFDLFVPVSRQSFFLTGAAGYDFHQKNDHLDRERYAVDGGVNSRVGPCSPSLVGSYARSQSDLQDVTLLAPENTLQTTTITAALSCQREPGLGANIAMTKGWADNSNPIQAQSDNESSSVTGGISYARPRLGVLQIFASHQEIDYNNRDVSLPGSNGYGVWAGGASFERKLGARIEGIVSLSYSSVEQNGVVLPGAASTFEGWTYGLDLGYRPTERLKTRLELHREIAPSTRVGRAYTVRERAAISADYELGARLVLGAGFQVIDEAYEGLIPVAGPGIILSDSRTNVVYGSLTFRQSKRLSLQFDVSRQERETNSPLYDYTSNRVGLTANVAF